MNSSRTLVAVSQRIHQRDITPHALVSDCLRQIELHDLQIKAWVLVDADAAYEAAERLTQELAAGRWRGPLHGIPVGIKDLVDVVDLPTRAGSALTSAEPARADAPIVERLRAAGAIILGKTVTTEFACFDPPPTRNPWNLAHTPGGSSSGSAAALATGMCLGAIGSQTGGSITRPASYCGVAGCKPTFGRVSRTGVVPVTFHLDHVGPMARTAADCAVLLQAIAGDDPRDPAASTHENFVWDDDSARATPPRLGVMRPFFFEQADAEIAKLTEDALEVLRSNGAHCVGVALPEGFDQVHVMHRRLMACEAADFHRRTYGAPRAGYSAQLAALLAEGLATSMADYQEALRHQTAFSHAMARSLSDIDAIVTPSTPSAAPASLATTGDPKFNSPWSHAGVPTVSIPCALTRAGLPTSLQFIGRPWSESRLLSVAAWCERLLGFDARPPIVD